MFRWITTQITVHYLDFIFLDKAKEAEAKAKEIWLQIETFFINLWNWSLKHKEIAIPVAVGILLVLILFFSCCCYCCCCRKKTRKKIKEKLKMKGVKPSKMLRRIQPGKRVKRVMVSRSNSPLIMISLTSAFLNILLFGIQ